MSSEQQKLRTSDAIKQILLGSGGLFINIFKSKSSTSQLTRVLVLEIGLALQCGWQVIEAERQLPLEGRVLLAEGWESPE